MEVLIGNQLWDLKSDHKPIYLGFSWTRNKQLGSKTQCAQQNFPKSRILLTPENCNTFKLALERLCEKEKIPFHDLHSHELTHLIQSALAECRRTKSKKSEKIAFQSMLGLTRNAKRQGECGKSQTKMT